MDALKEQLVTDFIGLIDEQCVSAGNLVQVGLAKQKFIIANDIDRLNELIQEESLLAAGFSRLEASRYRLQQQLTDFYDMPQQEATATAIIQKMQYHDQESAFRLKEKIQQLQAVVGRLKEVNRHNHELIGFSLDYLDFLQSMFEGDVAGVYSYDGQPAEGRTYRPGKKLLDQRV